MNDTTETKDPASGVVAQRGAEGTAAPVGAEPEAAPLPGAEATAIDARSHLGPRRAWARFRRFLTDDVWDMEMESLSAMSSLGVKGLRVVHLVVKGFWEDECPLHASALTFSTLMSIIPVFALSLAVAGGLGNREFVENRVRQVVSEWTRGFSEAVVPGPSNGGDPAAGESIEASRLAAEIDRLVEGGFDKVENINFAALGGVGLLLLVWSVIEVLGRVESSFNRVWGVRTGRSLWRKFSDYLSVLVVLPLLVTAASSLPIASVVGRYLGEGSAGLVRSLMGSSALKAPAVVAMTALTFAFLIMFMPNTRVKAGPGLAGGLVAALLFIGWMRLCAALQVGVGRYGSIYGSFAVVPIILAWVYVSWEIVLFGAEIAFAVQNCATYSMEQGSRRASVQARLTLALAVMTECAAAMLGRGRPFDVAAFARVRRVPVRFLNEVLTELVRAGLLGEVFEQRGRFVLLHAPDVVYVGDVVKTVLRSGTGAPELGLDRIEPNVRRAVADLARKLEAASPRQSLRDLL